LVAALLHNEWHGLLAREGLAPVAPAPVHADVDEPPCPACGSFEGLDEGACRDCGLQLA
jgi:hypothetical protein